MNISLVKEDLERLKRQIEQSSFTPNKILMAEECWKTIKLHALRMLYTLILKHNYHVVRQEEVEGGFTFWLQNNQMPHPISEKITLKFDDSLSLW